MDFSFRHDLWWALLPRSPQDGGRVELCVVRPTHGERRLLDALELEPGRGAIGDHWVLDPDRSPGAELALINAHVARAVARDRDHPGHTGDNLHVDLDLSEANLPVGTRLALGDALLEVSADIHRPCRSFHDRYGVLAAQRVARANRRGLRGRGVLCRVIRGGRVAVGDVCTVQREHSATERMGQGA